MHARICWCGVRRRKDAGVLGLLFWEAMALGQGFGTIVSGAEIYLERIIG